MTILETDELQKSFQGIQAVDHVDIAIDEGECVGLIGPNGAGKSTLFNCIKGVITPDDGSVRYQNEDITGLKPAKVARRGLIGTFQMARELGEMTVMENMALGMQDHPGETMTASLLRTDAAFEREQETLETAESLLEFLDLDHLEEDYASDLSGGQRKLLELGRVLMSEPSMILLDEPFAGVNPSLTNQIVNRIESLNEEGQTFFIVEHEIETLVGLCNRLIVLHNGQVLMDGTPEEVVRNDTVIDAYLGDQQITE